MIRTFVLADYEGQMLTISEAVAAYLRTQERLLAAATVALYTNSLDYLTAAFADVTLDQLTTDQLVDWQTGLFDVTPYAGHPQHPESDGQLSTYTIRRIVGDVRTFLNWCVAIGLLDASPAAGLKQPAEPERLPKALSVRDFDKLLAAAADWHGNKYNYGPAYVARNTAILYFLASTGCRVGGLCSAERHTLQVADDTATVSVTEKGKGGGATRTVYLSTTAALAVLEWLDYRPHARHDKIFTGIEGKSAGLALRPAAVRQMLNRLARRAGVSDNFNPHAFRHACAREWLRNGADLATVSQLLGHSDVRTTAKYYARWSDNELAGRHGAIDWTD